MENEFEKVAIRVSLVSVVWNLVLSVFKLIAGLVAHSGAMISDAVHSASDVFSSIIVMIGVRISGKASDKDHPYGHERMECVAAIVLATVLAGTGLGIGYAAVQNLLHGEYATEMPGILALIAAVVSIVVKEWMFWYTRGAAKKINSGALMADAWHHRSDAMSSVGAFVGIFGARMGYPILDPIASVVICLLIGKASIDIFRDAVDKMVDRSCDRQTEESIRRTVLAVEGVKRVDLLQTRLFGSKIYVDLEIAADGTQTLDEAHQIAEHVHYAIEHTFPDVKHCMVHVNPTE